MSRKSTAAHTFSAKDLEGWHPPTLAEAVWGILLDMDPPEPTKAQAAAWDAKQRAQADEHEGIFSAWAFVSCIVLAGYLVWIGSYGLVVPSVVIGALFFWRLQIVAKREAAYVRQMYPDR